MAGILGAALCALAVALPAQAQLGQEQQVKVSTTGIGGERIKKLPIAKRAGAKPRVVLSLSPGDVGDIEAGDSVWAGGDVEVSVTCLERMRQCVGRIYHFSPMIRLQAIMGSSPNSTRGTPVGRASRLKCSQKLPNRNHHCVVAFEGTTNIKNGAAPSCSPRCYVNFVIDASHRRARKGHLVVVGIDTDAGTVSQKKSTVSAAVSRPGPFADVEPITTKEPSTRRLPVGAQHSGAGSRKVVVMSRRLTDLRAGEQLLIDARVPVKTGHLRYGALLQSFLVLSEQPNSGSRVGVPSKVASLNGKITAMNGFNCTPGPSGHRSPCLVRKLGVVRIQRDARARPGARDPGPFVPLYVNLVMQSKAVFNGHRHRRGDAAKVQNGSLSVTRFGPEFD